MSPNEIPPNGWTLEQALHQFAAPEIFEKISNLEQQRADALSRAKMLSHLDYGDARGAGADENRKADNLSDEIENLRISAFQELREKLINGELLARGRPRLGDAPSVLIDPDQWLSLTRTNLNISYVCDLQRDGLSYWSVLIFPGKLEDKGENHSSTLTTAGDKLWKQSDELRAAINRLVPSELMSNAQDLFARISLYPPEDDDLRKRYEDGDDEVDALNQVFEAFERIMKTSGAIALVQVSSKGLTGTERSPATQAECIPAKNWQIVHRYDLTSSAMIFGNQPAAVPVRITAPANAPDLKEMLAGLSLGQAFRTVVLNDAALRKSISEAEKNHGRCKHILVGNYAVGELRWPTDPAPHDFEQTWFDREEWKISQGYAGWLNYEIQSVLKSEFPDAIRKAAQTVTARIKTLLGLLASGELKSKGQYEPTGRMQLLSPALWSRPATRIDFMNGDIYRLSHAPDSGPKLDREWSGILLCGPRRSQSHSAFRLESDTSTAHPDDSQQTTQKPVEAESIPSISDVSRELNIAFRDGVLRIDSERFIFNGGKQATVIQMLVDAHEKGEQISERRLLDHARSESPSLAKLFTRNLEWERLRPFLARKKGMLSFSVRVDPT